MSKEKGKDSKEDMMKKKKPLKPKNGKTPEAQCSRCLGQLHPKRLSPARESKCNKCCKVGPLAKACKSQSHKRVREVNFPGRQEEEKGFFLGELTELDAVQESTGEVKEQVYVTEYLQRPLLGRKPAELLKLISRLDSLSSNHYRIKVADKYPKLSKD